MATSRKRRLDLSDRACQQCQKRKTRCIVPQEGQPCAYCSKVAKPCVFSSPPSRTALTRKNLDELESRCKKLERIISKLQPDFDIDNVPAEELDRNDTAISDQTETRARAPATASEREESLADHDYEWRETETLEHTSQQMLGSRENVRDGMASLNTRSAQSGYLGDIAGSALLESVSSMLSPISRIVHEESAPAMSTARGSQNLLVSPSLTNQLNASALQSHLIDLYFGSYNVSYPILHERTFREQVSRRHQLPTDSIWNIIYYMVLAIGEWIGGYCSENQSLYYEAARFRLRIDLLEIGNVAVVQAFLMLGNYLQKRDRPNTGYNFIGIAYRVALGLGLHREVSAVGQANVFLQQRRRLLFWTLYCFESGFSITTGRPTLVSDSFIDVRKPKNIDNSQYASTAREVDHPTECTAITAQARLAVIANRIHTNFLSVRSCFDVDHQIAILERAIQNWRDSLSTIFWDDNVPRWFLGPRQVVLWKEANLRILLLIAGQRLQADEDDKAALGARCQNVAIGTISDISHFCQAHSELIHQGISWYAVYFLLQAALALSAHQLMKRHQFPRSRSAAQLGTGEEQWSSALNKAQECLEMLGKTNKAATRTRRLLERLRQNVDSPMNSADKQQAGSNADLVQDHSTRVPTVHSNDLASPSSSRSHSNAIHAAPLAGHVQGTTPRPLVNTSPADMVATSFVHDDWVGATDPSLHLFLDGAQSIDEIFQDLHGFPGTLEQENFAYTTSSMRTMRGNLFNDQWPDIGGMSNIDGGSNY